MIEICGNCEWYIFKNNPSSNGECVNKQVPCQGGRSFSPLTEACIKFKSKRR